MKPFHAPDKCDLEWWKWAPSGEIVMMITNPDAIAQFSLGEYYIVDFTLAD
ncbi:hypothetical protein [Hoeflea sp. TYP-13]|uniref:hypothetical protein n=1 Tax=Hoeflea sp. TYP-13 TaxID=3230023 RepID=UPI0034C5C759